MAQFQRPRGTRDFTPEEMKRRRWVENRMRHVISSYGYREIATPTFEDAKLFVEKSGPQVLEQMYSFEDKGGRSMALRPELTAPVMRFFYSELRNRPRPIRISYFGNCFRYERPQKGRYREFWQMGLEYIGKRSPLALAEVIDVAIAALRSAGLSRFTVRVGHVSLLKSILKGYGAKAEEDMELMISIDKKDVEGISSYVSERLGQDPGGLIDLVTRTYSTEEYLTVLENLRSDNSDIEDDIQEITSVMRLLTSGNRGTDIRLDPSISRGLDYYDGVVFEIDADDLGAEKQICGGGAYSLTSMFGGDVLGIGFGLGFDRIMVAMGETDGSGNEQKGVYVMPIGEGTDETAFSIASEIRSSGIDCIMETAGRNFGKAISYAITQGCSLMIVVGPDEIEKGKVAIKDLRSKEQTEVSIDKLIPTIDRLISHDK